MLDSDASTMCQIFFDELKREICQLLHGINQQNDGSLQDGFSTRGIEDGWIAYKGMSCGFALHLQPAYLYMTFGPDSPFVGYSIRLTPIMKEGKLIWIDDNGLLRFSSANQLACFAIKSLAAKVHDYLPELVDIHSHSSLSEAAFY